MILKLYCNMPMDSLLERGGHFILIFSICPEVTLLLVPCPSRLVSLEWCSCLSWVILCACFLPFMQHSSQEFILKVLSQGSFHRRGGVEQLYLYNGTVPPAHLLMGFDRMWTKNELWKKNQHADSKEDTQLSPQGISENCIIDSAS